MRIEELASTDFGRKVVYTAHHGETEEGVITSANCKFIFVRYGSDCHSKATDPEQLEFSTKRGMNTVNIEWT